MSATSFTTNIAFDKDGIQHNYLRVPHSTNESAWGSILFPVTVVKNGDGPTALLTGANHGDEYEGALALTKLTQNINISQISGRIIIVPFMNYPALKAGKRNSPIDGLNLNRCFPGKAYGSITEKIADYFQQHLLPLSDYVLDIHSDGKSLDFVPFAAIHEVEDKYQQQRCVETMEAFGAPYNLILNEIDDAGMYDSAAESMGKVFVTTELRGGGTVSPDSMAIAETGINNFLIHTGIKQGECQITDSTKLSVTNEKNYIFSSRNGLIEFTKSLGDKVKEKELIACVYDISDIIAIPTEFHSYTEGILAGRHFPGLIQAGDCLAVIAEIV